MMGGIIVFGSLALAGVFSAAWLLRPRLRRAIEAPKHVFAGRVQRYDQVCRADQRRDPAVNDS